MDQCCNRALLFLQCCALLFLQCSSSSVSPIVLASLGGNQRYHLIKRQLQLFHNAITHCIIFCKHNSIVGVDCQYHSFFVEDAWIHFALHKSLFLCQFVGEVLIPYGVLHTLHPSLSHASALQGTLGFLYLPECTRARNRAVGSTIHVSMPGLGELGWIPMSPLERRSSNSGCL